MAKVSRHTHWVPLYWRRRAHTEAVQAEFLSLFPLQVALVFQEVAAVLLLPYICLITLPRSADSIAHFLRSVRSAVPLPAPAVMCTVVG